HTPGSLPPPDADPNTGGRGREPFNVVDYAPLLRAALVSLDRWVTEGVEPPASNVPRLADGTAVLAEVTAGVFTKIPGVRFPVRAAYLERVRAAALALVAARHVLAEDLDAIVERAGRLWDWVQARVT